MWRSSLLAYLVSGSIPAVHTSSACAVMLATRRHKTVDQVPGRGSDLGSSAEPTRLTIRLRSDAHSGEPSKEVNANAGCWQPLWQPRRWYQTVQDGSG
jgi:hypothetical protein